MTHKSHHGWSHNFRLLTHVETLCIFGWEQSINNVIHKKCKRHENYGKKCQAFYFLHRIHDQFVYKIFQSWTFLHLVSFFHQLTVNCKSDFLTFQCHMRFCKIFLWKPKFNIDVQICRPLPSKVDVIYEQSLVPSSVSTNTYHARTRYVVFRLCLQSCNIKKR